MAQQTINLGAAPDDGTGDTLRVGGDKINDNFTELYAANAALGTVAPLDVDTDDTLAANSDALIPSQQAVKAYVDGAVAGAGAIEVLDEGVSETAALVSLDFVGAGVSANDDGSGNVTVTIAGGGSGIAVEDEGAEEGTGIDRLNFTGAGASVSVAGSEATINVPGGSTFAGARVRRTTDQTTADYSTETAIPWEEAVVDTDSFWSAGTPSRLTVPVAYNGRYANVQGQVRIDATTADTYKVVRLSHKDSGGTTKFIAAQSVEVGLTTAYVNVSLIGVPVATGDYFDMAIDEESDTSVTIKSASQSGFAIQIIG
jgi:hypothetical protein